MHSITLLQLSTLFYLTVSVLGVSLTKQPGALSLVQVPEIVDPNTTFTGDDSESDIDDEVLIAVMGATGTGKTTFINLASGSDLRIGHGLKSCTSDVEPCDPFELDGRLVTLLDTPGFDDTNKSDTSILSMISVYLSTMYEHDMKLSGVIYMHRISDNRVGGISRRNFNIFRELCGDDNLKNVLIVTNMWSDIDYQVGLNRENQLKSEERFFKPVLDKGAQLVRHDNTINSAHNIIRRVMKNKPAALRIQQEIIDQNKKLDDTGAGRLLNKELRAQAEEHRKRIEELHARTEDAMRARNEESRRELEIATLKAWQEIERIQEETAHMADKFDQDKVEFEERMKEMAAAAEREEERAAQEHRREMEKLQEQLKNTKASMAQERNILMQKIEDKRREFEHRRRRRCRGFFRKIGCALKKLAGAIGFGITIFVAL